MERDAVGLEAKTMGMLEHVDRHGRLAAELPRQRPLRPDAVGEDAAEHAAAGCAGGTSRSFLMVLRKEMRSAAAPAASAISISGIEAVSKQEPSPASSDSTSGAGLAFTA